MKRIDFAQAITVLSNLAVIVGIIALIIEIDQNSDSQAFQARALLLTARAEDQRAISQNAGGLVDLLDKVRAGEELTWAEEWRATVHYSNIIHTFAAIYSEVEAGTLDEQDLPIAQWMGTFGATPGLQEFWDNRPTINALSPNFIAFINEAIIAQ